MKAIQKIDQAVSRFFSVRRASRAVRFWQALGQPEQLRPRWALFYLSFLWYSRAVILCFWHFIVYHLLVLLLVWLLS
jgi:hypothetical protein